MSISSFGSFGKGKRWNNETIGVSPEKFEKAKLYFENDPNEPMESSKTILIRNRGVYLKYTFKNSQQFYKFLDCNKLFGLLEQFPENLVYNAAIIEEYKEKADDKNNKNKKNTDYKDLLLPTANGLIITYYDDLVANSKYRTVIHSHINKWVPIEHDADDENIDSRYSIEKCAILSKNITNYAKNDNCKVIGLRVYNKWLQIVFRYKWEFEQFIKDTQAMGLVHGSVYGNPDLLDENESSETVSTSIGASKNSNGVATTSKTENDKNEDNNNENDNNENENDNNSNEKKENEKAKEFGEALCIVCDWDSLESKDYRVVVNGTCDSFYTSDPLPKKKKMKSKSQKKSKSGSRPGSATTKSSFFGFGSFAS